MSQTIMMDFALGFEDYPCEWSQNNTLCGAPSEYFVQRFPKTGVTTAHKMICRDCLPIMRGLDKTGGVRERVIPLSEFCNLKGLL